MAITCNFCRAFKSDTECIVTPCSCFCHGARVFIEPPMGGRVSPDVAASLRAKNAQLVHVLKQLREVIQPSVPAVIRSYLDLLDPGVGDRLTTQKVLHRVERVGREIDDALIAFADDVAVKERAELQRQLAEARAAAEVQADALAEQAADMERLYRRLLIEFEKTRDMNIALSEVWEQVPDEDRIGKPADQWVRGLGRRVRELTAAPPLFLAEDERTV